MSYAPTASAVEVGVVVGLVELSIEAARAWLHRVASGVPSGEYPDRFMREP
jgi:hypothetical protein